MKSAEWKKIVHIEIVGERRENVRVGNTREAARCLIDKWPNKTGRAYKPAVLACSRALKGYLSDEIARIFLVEAAREANFTFSVRDREDAGSSLEAEIAKITQQLIAQEQIRSTLN